MSIIDPATLSLVKAALDAGALRQIAHANNIANAGTQGYQPFSVAFEENLGAVRQAVDGGTLGTMGLEEVPPARMFTTQSSQPVQLDAEVAAASANALHYQALTHLLSQQYALVSLAMSAGER